MNTRVLLLCLVVVASAEAKVFRVDNATSQPVAVSVGSSSLGMVPAGTSVRVDWDFVADAVEDPATRTATVYGLDGVGLLATSPEFTFGESERVVVISITASAGVTSAAVTDGVFRPATVRLFNAVVITGFLSGLITGAIFYTWRLSYETFQDTL